MPKNLTLEEVNQRLREINSEYECEKYVDTRSPKSVFTHIESGKPGESRYDRIIRGHHPSWSPSCKKMQVLDINIANQRLREANSEYECTFYRGRHSPNSLFVHIPTNTGPKKARYGNILKGQHPSWSPACKSRRDIDVNIANERLREANSEYECTFYDGRHSQNSLFVHLESKTGPLPSMYGSILRGQHPSWSPSCKKMQVLDITIVNQRLREANSEYECVKYVSVPSRESLFVHLTSGKGPLPSRYHSILNGHHPSWSPSKKNINRTDPSNDKLCTVYFCKTKTYGKGRGGRKLWTAGPFLTIGVTTGNTKSRYNKNGLIKTFFQTETYDCLVHEQALLDQITFLLGQPEAGTEAWKWTQEREDITRKLFLDHFLKDYIENI